MDKIKDILVLLFGGQESRPDAFAPAHIYFLKNKIQQLYLSDQLL